MTPIEHQNQDNKNPDYKKEERRNLIFGSKGDSAEVFSGRAKKISQAVKDLDRKFEEEETAKKAKGLGLDYFNLFAYPVNQEALIIIAEAEAEAAETIPFFHDRRMIKLGTVNPQNPKLDGLVELLKKKNYDVEVSLVSKSGYEKVLSLYKTLKTPRYRQEEVVITKQSPKAVERLKSLEEQGAEILKISATDLISELLTGAVGMRASDIHIQPEKDHITVRYRIDGVLQDIANFHMAAQKPLTSRIKILAKLKLNITTVPQDGSFVVNTAGKPYEIRVSLLPSAYGEAIVMRLLAEQSAVDIKELGFRGVAYEKVVKDIEKPHGMILTTGPTGSGKTTTLYSFLKQANQPGVKIITLENPVEYRLEGIEQIQIDDQKGLTFASALRSVLRQDPDVVMVGEIRDFETAEAASQAALTGHMVYSTLHTNDAAGAIPRLLNLGVKPVILAPAITTVIAQRLVRRLCQECKTTDKLDEQLLAQVKGVLAAIPASSKIEVPKELKFYRSPGCAACNNIGYKGRIGVFEVFSVDDEMQQLIYNQASTVDIKNLAVKNGMLTMLQDGLVKALEGITDVAEVFRVAEE
jgi:type IV pilus assembly protein PilB